MSEHHPERFRVLHRSRDGMDFGNWFNSSALLLAGDVVGVLDSLPNAGQAYGHLLHFVDVLNADAVNEVRAFIGGRLANALWGAGQWVQLNVPAVTDDTTDAQDAGADDFALQTLVNNDGFVAWATRPFNALVADVSTSAAAAAGYVSEFTYWNGTVYSDLEPFMVHVTPDATLFVTAAPPTEEMMLWRIPPDWTPTGSTGQDGIPPDRYAIRYRATNAPDTAALATTVSLYNLRYAALDIPAGGILRDHRLDLPVCSFQENLVAVFSRAGAHRVLVASEKSSHIGVLGLPAGTTR